MEDATSTVSVQDAIGEAPPEPAGAPRVRRVSRAVRIFAVAVLGFAGAYTLFERVGTDANIDEIEFYERFGGGFLAVGRTESQPGAVVLSLLDATEVDVEAIGRQTWLTGRSTRLSVTTPKGTWQRRLRGPLLVMIAADGSVAAEPVPWSAGEFARIAQAVDCSVSADGPQSCGAPFADLKNLLKRWARGKTPGSTRQFLAEAADPDHDPSDDGW